MSKADQLKTREQKFRDTRWNKMFIPRDLILSPAFMSLRGASCQVYLIFRSKCVMKTLSGKKGKRDDDYYIANDGELQFTYREANRKWGISEDRFKRAIDQLVRTGFIDIVKSGFGLRRDVSLYAISDRWQKFGTEDFILLERPKRTQQLGFRQGNKFGKNSRLKKKTTCENPC